MERRKWAFAAVGTLLTAVYLANASWPVPVGENGPYLVAHRGAHQSFDHAKVGPQDCTATQIRAPEHPFLENTIASMKAAFEAGARIVELDIHPTTDGEFAVIHDWRLECRTNGKGVVRQQSMAYLRTLDAGWGYTADGDRTYPFRGKAVGAIPTLGEVLAAFPNERLLINFKSRDVMEADRLANYLDRQPTANLTRLLVYGDDGPVRRFTALRPQVPGFDSRIKQCLKGYLALGWAGYVPESCRNTILMIPHNYAWLLWGWPRRFEQRMRRVRTDVWLIGEWDGKSRHTTGIDSVDAFESVPADFRGGIWTNRILAISAAARRKPQVANAE